MADKSSVVSVAGATLGDNSAGFCGRFLSNTQFIITSHSIAILNKTKIDDIIASTINENGLSELYNISSRKDLKNKLRKSTVNFSDELFFYLDDKNEFE